MHSTPILRKILLAAALVAATVLPSCGGGGGPAGAGSGYASITLEGAFWGRLVDVFDGNGLPVEEDVMVRQGLQSDGVQYTLSLNPVTQREVLTIHTAWKDSQGNIRAEFESLFDGATSGLDSVTAKGFETNGNYTRVARNGAIKLVFSEYLDPASVNRLTLPVVVNDRITDLRYIVKEGVGSDGDPRGFVFLDPTITPIDSANHLIPENGVGFAPSPDQLGGNAVIRIPTEIETAYGQTQVVTNKAGTRTLGVTNTDPVDYSDGLKEVVIRVFRTGNADDPANGFMKDNQRPELQADLEADIYSVADSGQVKVVTYRIRPDGCRAITAKVGDVLQTTTGIMLVTAVLDSSDINAVEVQCSVIDGSVAAGDYSSNPLDGDITTVYRAADEALQWCWVRFDPAPGTLPATDVDPYATVSLRFSEPIDPASVLSLETMVIHRYNATTTPPDPHSGFDSDLMRVGDFIRGLPGYSEDDLDTGADESGSGRLLFGPITFTADSRDFILAPSAGFTDAFGDGADLRFGIAVRDGLDGILDLAGNPLGFSDFVAGSPGQTAMTLTGTVPTDGYFTLRMGGVDENDDGLPEYKGQYIQDSENGTLKGRDLIRYSRQADPNANQWIGQRAAWSQSGLSTPLTPGGAVLVTFYGYHHLGLGLKAPSEYNLDVEGLNWSPFNGLVLDDFFPRYSIALAHCNRYPDDYIDTATGYPDYPKSGLKRNAAFDNNILGFDVDPFYEDEEVVFDTGYDIIGSNTFVSESGAVYAPWPTFDQTYTWRDNSMAEDMTGGPDSSKAYGVPLKVTGQDPYYKAGEWPSVVAPLMMRFRCYPRGDFFGWNGFQVQIMVPSSNQPAFRVFSFGGNGSELVVPDVPESGTKPTGGTATGGGTQKGYGPELYWGQVDFVVKVSRVFTHWFSFGGTFNGIGPVVQEPVNQPEGSSVTVEWRGTEIIDMAGGAANDPCDSTSLHLLNDANQLDDYGEFRGAIISRDRLEDPPDLDEFCESMSDPSDWTSNPASLAAEAKWKFFQLRITFVSNIEKDLEPELDAYGFSWTVQ